MDSIISLFNSYADRGMKVTKLHSIGQENIFDRALMKILWNYMICK